MAREREDQAFCLLPTSNLQADVMFFTATVGFELTALYPADKPLVAELSGYGLRLRLDSAFKGAAPTLVISGKSKETALMVSPGGVEIRREASVDSTVQCFNSHELEVSTLRNTPWIHGKAGAQSRELIPSRLGGGITAKHIRIPNGGPVADPVHYHTVSFQFVYCVRGWITIVYEDQGEPVTLHAGDCVTQPPHIRHKVIETSNGLELIDICLPAEHITAIDNKMTLPNGRVNSHRLFDGQRFCHHHYASARWQPHRLPGFSSCDTGVCTAAAGVAGVRIVKAASALPPYVATHDANVLFSYVLSGSIRIDKQLLVAGDAVTMPPDAKIRIGDISDDLQLLELSVPGSFKTLI